MKRTLVLAMLIAISMTAFGQSITSFSPGSSIQAATMNANFQAIVDEITALKARVATLEAEAFPVGAVIASFVAPTGGYMTGSNGVWKLADGSAMPGTYTAGLPNPDMRGKFIRGLNAGAAATAGSTDPDAARSAGSFQADAFQDHKHWLWMYMGSAGSSYGVQPGNGAVVNQSAQMATADLTSGTRASTETRPVNVAVYWYIKVK